MSADERHDERQDVRPEARRKLGRGLSALLGEARREEPLIAPARESSGKEAPLNPAHGGEGLATVAVALIEPHPEQPRRHFDEATLDELAASIAKRGVIQPVIVRPLAGGRYQLVAGERADDHRLDHAALGDRGRELLERGLVELPARLVGMRLDRRDRQAGEPFAAPRRRDRFVVGVDQRGRDERLLAPRVAEQRAEAPAEPALGRMARIGAVVGAHAATSCLRRSLDRRPISSRASAM